VRELTPGFIVAHGHRLEDLTEVAVKFTQNYPLAPLEQETVLVQSNGIAQWLKINLAQASGIAAMVDVTLPARFQWQAYRAVLGDDIPKTSPFDKDRLTWRILRLLPSLVEQNAHFSPLANYLQSDDDGRKLYQLSERLADLFDQYAVYRADWLDAWILGKNELESGQTVPQEQLWQPELWRALSNDIGIDDYWNNRAELHRRFIEQAKSLQKRPAGLPPRIVVFGISSLPQQVLEVLDALKGYTQVLLCVHNPSQFHWADIVDGKEALREAVKATSRLKQKDELGADIDDDELHQLAQPLLASWGKQGRDYIRLLDLYDETLEKQEAFNNVKLELFEPHPTEHLLAQLQDDILNLRPLHETRQQWPRLDDTDKSIQFHVCHSPQRELEVLHDQLLDAFANDPDLKPRDIMVMLPDVNTYAPYIDAVFGRYHRRQGERDPRAIPYTIADQGERHQRPLMIALELLLQADQLRFTQTDLFDLLSVPAVQQRFGIDDGDLPLLKRWVAEAGARWGLNAKQRAPFFMPNEADTNSWWFALKRMVSGYVLGEQDEPWSGIEPYHEVAGLTAELAGRLVDVIRALENWWQRAVQQSPVTEWVQHSEWLLTQFFLADEDADRLLIGKLNRELFALNEIVDEAENDSEIALTIFKDAWLARVDQQNLNQRFLAGAVNFATLMPMRAIPFKYVCVLGMNESEYPRSTSRVDFDLMTDRYRPGDRSRRDDDRYLFLEALLSARKSFYVSWVGYSAKDNSERTPSVLVAQLRDHLAQGWQIDAQQLTTVHRLQAFSPAYFEQNGSLFSYAGEWVQAHQGKVLAGGQVSQRERAERSLTLNDISRFIKEPPQLYFNWMLDTYFTIDDDTLHDSETFELDGLSRWALNARLLTAGKQALLIDEAGVQAALDKQLQRMQREGQLGVGIIAQTNAAELLEQSTDILSAYQEALARYPQVNEQPIEVNYEYAGLSIDDTLDGVHRNSQGERIWINTSTSSIVTNNGKGITDKGWKHAISYYAGYLLLNLQQPTRLLIISKGGCQLTVGTLTREQAEQQLKQLLGLMSEAISEPHPMHWQLALAWLEVRDNADKDPEIRADRVAAKLYEDGDFNNTALLTSTDYCSRVATSFQQVKQSPLFLRFMNEVYRPIRLTLVKEDS
jgi:exodeoxyribonuclease V gamma subunit